MICAYNSWAEVGTLPEQIWKRVSGPAVGRGSDGEPGSLQRAHADMLVESRTWPEERGTLE